MESKKYQNSLSLLKRAKLVTPIGSQTYSKSYRYFCEGVSPAFIDRLSIMYLEFIMFR